MWRYVPSTMLFAARLSAVTKKPRLRLTISRSSSVNPFGFFHSSMSRCMFTSCGIQWFAHADRYLSHAHLYLNGTSWLTSAEPLMTRLSSMRTRRKPFSIAWRSTSRSCTGSRDRMPPIVCARIVSGVIGCRRGCGAGVTSSSKVSIVDSPCCSLSFCGVIPARRKSLGPRVRGDDVVRGLLRLIACHAHQRDDQHAQEPATDERRHNPPNRNHGYLSFHGCPSPQPSPRYAGRLPLTLTLSPLRGEREGL